MSRKKKDRNHLTDAERRSIQDIESLELDEEYPHGLDWHPANDLHKKTLPWLMEMARRGRAYIRYVSRDLDEVDAQMECSVRLSEADKKAKQYNPNRPVGVVVPSVRAAYEAGMTYFDQAFFREPFDSFRGEGDNNSAVKGAMLERVQTAQHRFWGEKMRRQTLVGDSLTAGFCMGQPVWSKHYGSAPAEVRVTMLIKAMMERELGINARVDDRMFYQQDNVLIAEGNKLLNINPRRALIDPNINPNDPHACEFKGYWDRRNYKTVMREAGDPEYGLFNMKALQLICEHEQGQWTEYDLESMGVADQMRDNRGYEEGKDTSADIMYLYVDLIPSERGFYDTDRPEKWCFQVAGGRLIIQAQRCDTLHGWDGLVFGAMNTNGHPGLPKSPLWFLLPLARVGSWHLNTRIAAVAKGMNDTRLINPYAWEWDDVVNTDQGKLLRLAEHLYLSDKPLTTWYQQMPYNDVSQGIMADYGLFNNIQNQFSPFSQMDPRDFPERAGQLPAMTMEQSQSRLEWLAGRFGCQTLDPLARIEAMNTIQYMQKAEWVDLHGSLEDDVRLQYGAGPNIQVTPLDVRTRFSVRPHDSRNRMKHQQAITEVMKAMPPQFMMEVATQSDALKIFSDWAYVVGLDDYEKYRKAMPEGMAPTPQLEMMAPEQYANERQAGNVVPLRELRNVA